ncbi:MAG: PaaI family thioesterase [Actinobacteria bacterium]|nr:PaaI family thioesterase [Actinomycetota bacterium]
MSAMAENSTDHVDAMLSSGNGALMEKMGLEWIEVTPERTTAKVPVEGNTQPFGLFHGGASACLAETIASVGAWVVDQSKITMGIEIKVNHIRAATSGSVTGVGTPLFIGRSIQVWEVRMTNDEGELTAFSTVTISVREPRG